METCRRPPEEMLKHEEQTGASKAKVMGTSAPGGGYHTGKDPEQGKMAQASGECMSDLIVKTNSLLQLSKSPAFAPNKHIPGQAVDDQLWKQLGHSTINTLQSDKKEKTCCSRWWFVYTCLSFLRRGYSISWWSVCVESLVSSSGRAESPGVWWPRQCGTQFTPIGTGVVQPGFKFWLFFLISCVTLGISPYLPPRIKVECCEAPMK